MKKTVAVLTVLCTFGIEASEKQRVMALRAKQAAEAAALQQITQEKRALDQEKCANTNACKDGKFLVDGDSLGTCDSLKTSLDDLHTVFDNATALKRESRTLTPSQSLPLKNKAEVFAHFIVQHYADDVRKILEKISENANKENFTIGPANIKKINIRKITALNAFFNTLYKESNGGGFKQIFTNTEVEKRNHAFRVGLALFLVQIFSPSDFDKINKGQLSSEWDNILKKNLWALDVLWIHNFYQQCFALDDGTFSAVVPNINFWAMLKNNLQVSSGAPAPAAGGGGGGAPAGGGGATPYEFPQFSPKRFVNAMNQIIAKR
ncbi:MAG: hypothetical protein H6849_04670 [Alphaproteobacteria bacterium]|nr:MAG: hypothetical protein H6849_04670 [Alphaproteobacteria bacterium]